MKLRNMTLLPDEDEGTFFHSVAYDAEHYTEFKAWCEAHCRGRYGYEESMAYGKYRNQPALWFGWLYDDRDAMLFKLSFS